MNTLTGIWLGAFVEVCVGAELSVDASVDISVNADVGALLGAWVEV